MSERELGVRSDELDGTGALFGYKFTEGGSTGLVTIYIEDDSWWHPKMTIDKFWLKDLSEVVAAALLRKAYLE